jgi:hypothetical protein
MSVASSKPNYFTALGKATNRYFGGCIKFIYKVDTGRNKCVIFLQPLVAYTHYLW